jgi:hypothetical protein
MVEAAFRGNEAMAALLLRHGATDAGYEASRYMGKGERAGPHSASAWATARGRGLHSSTSQINLSRL